MKAFAQLYAALDATTKTNQKVDALVAYLRAAAPEDAVWAIHFLIGRRIKRLIETRKLVEWAIAEANIPEWIFGDCYSAVGDLAETIALLLPAPIASTVEPLHYWIEERLLPLPEWSDEQRRESLVDAWRAMDEGQRFVWNKLITGEFRVGVSQNLVVRALASFTNLTTDVVAHRLMGDWLPSVTFYRALVDKETGDTDVSRPYPFFLAYPIEGPIDQLGAPSDWIAEWKWDGIRSQLIRRRGRTFVWSRGEELVTERFPELQVLGERLPEGTVIDGEILPWKNGLPLPFAQMQRRIGRKVLSPKILADVPIVLLAYDLLEWRGKDIRDWPIEARRAELTGLAARRAELTGLAARRAELATLHAPGLLILSEPVPFSTWENLAELRSQSRERRVEGFMLKRRGSPYRVGRRRGDWWKWKIEPYSIDCVLIYAQPGNGRRASLLTDYTFGIWDAGELVPFAKAYSGLSDEEIAKVDAWVRRNTLERFGPVRRVKPELVFELAFEGIQKSTRHRSGIAVRFPRMARWREDKKAQDADSIETIRALLP
jgi:DNA ligase-1